MPIIKIVSGGQTGIDQSALDTAKVPATQRGFMKFKGLLVVLTPSIRYWIAGMTISALSLAGCQTTKSNQNLTSELKPSLTAPYQSKAYRICLDKDFRYLSKNMYLPNSPMDFSMGIFNADRLNQFTKLSPSQLKVDDFCDIMEFCSRYDSLTEKQREYQSQYVQQVLTPYKNLREALQNLYEYEKHVQKFTTLGGKSAYDARDKTKWFPNIDIRIGHLDSVTKCYIFSIDGDTNHLNLAHIEHVSPTLKVPPPWSSSIDSWGTVIDKTLWTRASSGVASSSDIQKVRALDGTLSYLERRYEYTLSYARQTGNPLILEFLSQARSRLDELKEFTEETKPYYRTYLEQAAVDEARRVAKVSLTQEHLIKSYTARHLPEDRFKINLETGDAIESVAVCGKYIDIQIRHFELNNSQSPFGSVVVYYEGVNLGSPVDKKALILPARSDQEDTDLGMIKETVYQYRFKAEQALAQSGKIDVQLRCPAIQLDSTINYTASQKIQDSAALASTASYFSGIIECRRVGNHLYVPTSLNIDGVSVGAELLLDTGASSTCISEKLYKKGNSKSLTSLFYQKISTANGVVRAPTDRMEVTAGGIKKDLVVLILADDIGLLGVDFFQGYTYTIDVGKARILVSPTM